jgi:uncharacterized protein (TIGR02453 family)
MLAFLEKIIPEIALFDPEVTAIQPKDCIFRIYRDVRFSNDKSPYKTHIGAFISKTGHRGNNPGYYIHLEPGQSFLAGGLYMPPPDLLKAVRNEIYFNTEEFKAIIGQPDFIEYFGKLDDFEKLTRPPKGFAADWPDIDLLKYKSYVVTHHLTEENLFSSGLAEYSIKVFNAIFPLNNFLQKARNNSE